MADSIVLSVAGWPSHDENFVELLCMIFTFPGMLVFNGKG